MNHKGNDEGHDHANNGARKMKDMVLRIGSELIEANPPNAMAAGKSPISVWDEEEGIPNHQVTRFQVIAPIRPAKITSIISCPLTTSVLNRFGNGVGNAMVFKMKKATKLNIAAQSTACAGVSTFGGHHCGKWNLRHRGIH